MNSFLKSMYDKDQYIAANAMGSTDIATMSSTLSYDSHPSETMSRLAKEEYV